MFLFAFVIYYTSTLLADCYRTGDPLFGKRNYTYMDAVRSNLGTLHIANFMKEKKDTENFDYSNIMRYLIAFQVDPK